MLLLNDIAIILLNAHYVWIKLRWVKFYYVAVWEFYKENERNFKILYKNTRVFKIVILSKIFKNSTIRF